MQTAHTHTVVYIHGKDISKLTAFGGSGWFMADILKPVWFQLIGKEKYLKALISGYLKNNIYQCKCSKGLGLWLPRTVAWIVSSHNW